MECQSISLKHNKINFRMSSSVVVVSALRTKSDIVQAPA